MLEVEPNNMEGLNTQNSAIFKDENENLNM